MNVSSPDLLNQSLNLRESDKSLSASEIRLPVMDALLKSVFVDQNKELLKKTAIYYVHHPLRTSINVIDAILQLGAKPQNIFILGKRYSECESVVTCLSEKGVHYQPCSLQSGIGQFSYSFIRDINWLWAKLIQSIDEVEEILIMDHGGHAVRYLPQSLLNQYKIIGIEKTTAGFIDFEKKGLPPIPIIDVANSATKRFIESPLIAEAVVNKILSYLPENKNELIFGVVGLGSIGQAVLARLQALGCRLIAHDNNPTQMISLQSKKNVVLTTDITALIASSDYIFGCSGRDISEGNLEQFRLSAGNKTLISCSSEDKEFLSLLQMINQSTSSWYDPLKDIEYKTALGASIYLLRGGFPINFDNSGESVPANDIQLTRSLVLAAVLQASAYFKKESIDKGIYALDPTLQRFIIKEWLKCQEESRIHPNDLANYLNENWLESHSKDFSRSTN